jgi:hypothetical protein
MYVRMLDAMIKIDNAEKSTRKHQKTWEKTHNSAARSTARAHIDYGGTSSRSSSSVAARGTIGAAYPWSLAACPAVNVRVTYYLINGYGHSDVCGRMTTEYRRE